MSVFPPCCVELSGKRTPAGIRGEARRTAAGRNVVDPPAGVRPESPM
ncbi:hypothetical protein O7632_19095 [Solwaraspora sp. WMMD406]|nr:hypothetical protein [Solwaraspora sp. WMMD406]MDG4766192.1 hypothetical protein [Solwaraspora sp. WMMD406]